MAQPSQLSRAMAAPMVGWKSAATMGCWPNTEAIPASSESYGSRATSVPAAGIPPRTALALQPAELRAARRARSPAARLLNLHHTCAPLLPIDGAGFAHRQPWGRAIGQIAT